MAKEQEICLAVLDELVKEYAQGTVDQTKGARKQCDDMRQALRAGDVDTGLAIMREVCPAALEDVRLVFRAKKQKFVELLRSGAGPEAALACARRELAPLALDAYPEAYGEFKRLLLLLLFVPKPAEDPQQHSQPQQPEPAGSSGPLLLRPPGPHDGSGYISGAGSLRLGAAGVCCGPDSAGLWDPASTAEFADLAYSTVRSMLGLQQPMLSLQLRFLLRLHGSYGTASGREGAAVAAELGPRLRVVRGATTGGDRDVAPLPPLTSGGGGGSGPPSFPESRVQAVIHGAGTSRAAAMDALKRSGGDALDAFKAEVGRLRLNEQLLAELALEYGRFRGLLSVQEADALEARAAGGACGPSTVAPATTAAAHPAGAQLQPSMPQQEQRGQLQPQQGQHQQQQHLQISQQQQQKCVAGTAAGPGRPGPGPAPYPAGPGPLGLARGDASWAGGSPPNKVARRSPPAEEAAEGSHNGAGGGGDGKAGGQRRMETDRRGAEGPGQPSAAGPLAPSSGSEGAAGVDGGPEIRASPGETSQGPDPGPGSASGSAAAQQNRGQSVLSELLRLGQEGDAEGVLSLVESVDPALWAEHPALLFDVRRCQYGKLLAEGEVTQALELARRELTPLATANPALLPLLKSAMAALLPPLPGAPPTAPPAGPGDAAATPATTRPAVACPFISVMPDAQRSSNASTAAPPAAAATSGLGTHGSASASSLLPSLPVVVGAIQSVLQPRLGVQGPRLIRLMEGLLASHRAWLRAEKMSSDPFAEAMRITALRATPSAAGAAAGAAAGTAALARQQSAGAGAAAAAATPPSQPLPPPPLPLPAGVAGVSAAARALERALRETETAVRGLVHPWYEMEQQILAQIEVPYGRDMPPPPPPGGLYGIFGGGAPGLRNDDGHGGAGAGRGGGGGAAAAGRPGVMAGGGEDDDDDDDDDDSGDGDGMEVDEEGVLRLMEILELPRGAAVELLQNHDGDVQAAVLSVMQ